MVDTLHGKIQNTFGSGLGTPPYGSIGGGAGGEPGAEPVFGFLNPTSGTTNLPTSLTINGTPVEASLYYSASTATTSSWVPAAGETLSVVGSGSDPTISETLSPFTDGTPAARISASGKYYQGADGYSSADLGTDDFVFVAAVRSTASSSTNYLFKRANADTASKGWNFRSSANTTLRFTMSNGTTQVDHQIAVGTGSWEIIVVCCDRDAATSAHNLRSYRNGIIHSSVSVAAVGDVANTSPLTIGAYSDDTNVNLGDIGFLGMWKGANLFTGDASNITEMARIAAEVSYKLMGAYPAYNAGTSVQHANAPRAGIAYIHKDVDGDQVAHLVGNNWIRVGNVGLGKPVGIMHENSCLNACVRSSQLDNAAWTKTNTTVTPNTLASLYDNEVLDTINTNTTNGEHYITNALNLLNISSYRYVLSGYAKAINRNWVYANMFDGYDGYDCYFDLSTGTVGSTPGAGLVEYGIELARASDSLYRWWIAAALPDGKTGYYTSKFGIAEADNDPSFAESGTTAAVYAGLFQYEQGPYSTSNRRPTTIYPSDGTPITRNGDIIYYQLDGYNHPDTGEPRTYLSTTYSDELRNIYTSRYFLNTYGASNSQTLMARSATSSVTQGYAIGGGLEWNIGSGGANTNTTTTLTQRLTAEVNSVKYYTAGVQISSEDTAATAPIQTSISVGTNANGTAITNGVTTKLLIYDEIIAPGERRTGDDI